MIERRSQLDKIIITAMDRFVWFVLLVVMTHLVTEFTRVTGYARGQRHELVLVNDTLLQPMPVQNMLLYPGHEYSHYDRPQQPASGGGNTFQQNAALVLGNLGGGNGGGSVTSNNAEPSYPFFSLRPLIDSIFEIPISTLRAVNNLVGRLTGSYRHATDGAHKSVTIEADEPIRLPATHSAPLPGTLRLSAPGTAERQAMHEELA